VQIGARAGGFEPPRTRVEVEMRGASGAVSVDGEPHEDCRFEDDALVVGLPDAPAARTVSVRR
jgi:hypothetical protein